MIRCKNCNTENSGTSHFCRKCGREFVRRNNDVNEYTIVCPYCKTTIDSDSCFCPLCGKEIFYCLKCRKPSRGKRCTICGAPLIKASDKASMIPMLPGNRLASAMADTPMLSVRPLTPTMPSDSDPTIPEAAASVAPQEIISAEHEPTMLVRTDKDGVSLLLTDGAIIGRVNGQYARQLSNMGYLSAMHARLRRDKHTREWSITDLHSTNGTKVNGRAIIADIPQTFGIGDIITLAFTDFKVI